MKAGMTQHALEVLPGVIHERLELARRERMRRVLRGFLTYCAAVALVLCGLFAIGGVDEVVSGASAAFVALAEAEEASVQALAGPAGHYNRIRIVPEKNVLGAPGEVGRKPNHRVAVTNWEGVR